MTQIKHQQAAKYTVMGNPIAHSLSPEIHQYFAQQCKIPLEYTRTFVPQGAFAASLKDFILSGGLGANVTVPFKHEAALLCDTLTPTATMAGSVNTLRFINNHIEGHNTDGEGLIRDLRDNLNITLQNSRILIIGAGGAVNGILPALMTQSPASILIANRSLARADALLKRFAQIPYLSAVDFDGLNALNNNGFDLVIHATSAGLEANALPHIPDPFHLKNAVCYDICYGDAAKSFSDWAKNHHASALYTGFGMLVEQAAAAFAWWHEISPNTRPLIQNPDLLKQLL